MSARGVGVGVRVREDLFSPFVRIPASGARDCNGEGEGQGFGGFPTVSGLIKLIGLQKNKCRVYLPICGARDRTEMVRGWGWRRGFRRI